MLSRVARRNGRLLSQLRSYASQPALAEENAFLRFGSPYAAQLDLSNAVAQLPETQVTRLPNGLRVASESVPFAETATVGVWINAGSRYETDATNGTAHFLEHMAFKGTTNRTVKELEVEIENMGGHLNAYTSREQTCYYAKVFQKDVPKALEILSDILQNSNLDERAIERERGVILREMEETENITEEVVFDHLHATAFQHTPLGRTILGPAANVQRITRDDLANYIATHYTTNRMVVSAAGAVDHGALVKAVEKHFAKLPQSETSATDLVKAAPSYFTGSDVRIRDPDQSLLHFAIAFKGASNTDADSVPLMVMQTMLGSWDKRSGAGANSGSRLAQTLAINGLAESYMAFNTNYHDTGLWGVYAVADPHVDHQDLCWALMNNVTRLCYEVNEEDVARARNQLKASMLFQQDGTTGMAESIGRELLIYGRRIPRAELFARIDAVDADTVKAVAQRFIMDQDIAISALGDTQFLPDYNWLRRRTYWLRY